MTTHFIAVPAQGSVVTELGTLLPANPFATVNFFEARRQLGYANWVLGLRDNENVLECGCGAFLRRGRLTRTLEIPSLPAVGVDSSFWIGLRGFCHDQGVMQLQLDTFGSPPGVEIPPLGSHYTQRIRCEFVIDVTGPAILTHNHSRNVKKAEKAALAVRRTRTAEAVGVHHALMSQSIGRRNSRGENIGLIGQSGEDIALLQSGAGYLYQAFSGTKVLSSALVLRAPKGGYYQSAGTSPEGMAVGASHFLIHSIASQLSGEGAQIFNLGGAEEASSLALFKQGFGASRVLLSASDCYVGPLWRRRVSRVIALIRYDRATLLRSLLDQCRV